MCCVGAQVDGCRVSIVESAVGCSAAGSVFCQIACAHWHFEIWIQELTWMHLCMMRFEWRRGTLQFGNWRFVEMCCEDDGGCTGVSS